MDANGHAASMEVNTKVKWYNLYDSNDNCNLQYNIVYEISSFVSS